MARWWLAGVLAFALVGCAPAPYVPPGPDEPHARVTVRVVHHVREGPHLHHRTALDGHEVPIERPDEVVGTPMVHTVRVRPGLARWRAGSRFYHTEQRTETVYETERYACGTEQAGYGSGSYTRTRYCSRQVSRQRTRTITVTDGACSREIRHRPIVGQQYVLRFDYHEHGRCELRCLRQLPQPGGRFHLEPCR
ncbi:MAG TPA: hypothetical protein RMH99_13625 [Sandaracinaceae bacterium LLY-WYZ-13_1]|nr:hypothetical protein [Sandaracinaceae bacterium LLY-WYZ-13_1]